MDSLIDILEIIYPTEEPIFNPHGYTRDQFIYYITGKWVDGEAPEL
jgi:hypothetical protein